MAALYLWLSTKDCILSLRFGYRRIAATISSPAAPQGMSEAEVRAAAAAEVMSLLSAGRECATLQNTDRYREK